MVLPSKKLTDFLVTSSTVTEEDKEIYQFGFHQLEVTLLNLATALIIGLLCHMLWQGLLFLVVYIPLRKFAGGYHAQTELRCYILSTLILVLALGCTYVLKPGVIGLVLAFVPASAVILWLAPIDSPNKPLDTTEYRVYRVRSKIVLCLHWVLFLSVSFFDLRSITIMIVMADITVAGMLLFGHLKNKSIHCA